MNTSRSACAERLDEVIWKIEVPKLFGGWSQLSEIGVSRQSATEDRGKVVSPARVLLSTYFKAQNTGSTTELPHCTVPPCSANYMEECARCNTTFLLLIVGAKRGTLNPDFSPAAYMLPCGFCVSNIKIHVPGIHVQSLLQYGR